MMPSSGPDQHPSTARGRGAQSDPPNRFERTRLEREWDALPADDELLDADRAVPTTLLADASRTVISENNSPDVPFRYSVNPYRGCEHGCAYCYARPTHETLGLGAGLDFESKIVVKYDVARLLRRELCRKSWRAEVIALSGVTDCYQPTERKLQLTRQCLQVMHAARQPLSIVTKNVLVLRDLDILAEMAAANLANVNISLTTLDAELARTMEPRTAAPQARLRAISALAQRGVPVRVLVAPVIPGLNDEQLPGVLKAAGAAGAHSAGYVLLRLPQAVRPVFIDWLARNYPLKQPRVESLIRDTRGGQLNDARFGSRMRGSGAYADQLRQAFQVFAARNGLDGPLPELDSTQFRPPRDGPGQLTMFE